MINSNHSHDTCLERLCLNFDHDERMNEKHRDAHKNRDHHVEEESESGYVTRESAHLLEKRTADVYGIITKLIYEGVKVLNNSVL